MEDARDAAIEGRLRPLAAFGVYDGELSRSGQIAEELQNIDHRAVVERNVARIAFARWKGLRPATVRILRLQNHVDGPEECGLVARFVRRLEGSHQEPCLTQCRPVVERAAQILGVARVALGRRIDVFRPTSRRRLVAQHVVHRASTCGAAVPVVRLLGVIGPGEIVTAGERSPGDYSQHAQQQPRPARNGRCHRYPSPQRNRGEPVSVDDILRQEPLFCQRISS